jgi:small conductance mechanosensitive channel
MKSLIYRLMLIAVLFLSAPAAGQEQSAHQDPDVAAIDRILSILSEESARQQLVKDLRTIRESLTATATGEGTRATAKGEGAPSAVTALVQNSDPQQDVILTNAGLLGALSEWLSEITRRLPNAALGAPIKVRVEQAETQIAARLSQPDTLAQVKKYLSAAIPAWAAAAGIFWSLSGITRTRLTDRGLIGLHGLRFAGRFAFRLVVNFLPAAAATSVMLLAGYLFQLSAPEIQRILLPAAPLIVAVTTSLQFCLLIALLGRSRGWRLVAYAKRRLAPWVGIIMGLSASGSAMATPTARDAFGWATADVTALALDLAAATISLVTVVKHRRTVRSLIVKRGRSRSLPKSTLHRAVTSLGNRWHLLAYTFLTLNIVARLLGTGQGSFIFQALASVLIIVTSLIVVSALDRRFELYAERTRRKWNTGTREVIAIKVAQVAKSLGQAMIFLAAAAVCLGMWGFDFWGWLRTAAGEAVIRPIVAIVTTVLVSWLLWISLDAWIEKTLMSNARGGQSRSARIKTLLPLLRNFAFVVLIVFIVIAVLANLGVNVAPLLAGAGVVGLAIGFGSQQLVQDVITGLFILVEDTLAIGEAIDTGDRAGTVEALTIRTVKIRDGDGALHSIPFSSIKAIKNSSRDFGVYTVSVTLDSSADVDRALQVMKQVGQEVAEDPRFSPVVLVPLDVWGVDQVTPDGIIVKGTVKTRALQQWGVGREINRRLISAMHEAGVPVASRTLLSHPVGVADGVRGPAPA